jgi:arginine deiminase
VLPRQAGQLLFAGLPWAARAQQEHDIFTQVLRDHGVQVRYLTNLLVLAPGLVVTHERNVATLARLERCGIESITVPGNELCGARGGPRSLCCPVSRDPAPLPAGLRTEL